MARSDQYLIQCNIMDRWAPFLWGQEGCSVEKGETEVFFTSVKFPQGHLRNSVHMFRKTWFPKVTQAKSINAAKRIQSSSSHRSWALILKPSGETANGGSSRKSLHPLCLTVTLYFCLHSSLPFFLNACPFLSIPLYINPSSLLFINTVDGWGPSDVFGVSVFVENPHDKKRQSNSIIIIAGIIRNSSLFISSQTAAWDSASWIYPPSCMEMQRHRSRLIHFILTAASRGDAEIYHFVCSCCLWVRVLIIPQSIPQHWKHLQTSYCYDESLQGSWCVLHTLNALL